MRCINILFISLIILLGINNTILAQTYSFDKKLLEQLTSKQLNPNEIEVLKVVESANEKEEIALHPSELPNKLQVLKKCSNLKELHFNALTIGKAVDTIITFDPETFEETVRTQVQKGNWYAAAVLPFLGSLKKLEVLHLDFGDFYGLDAAKDLDLAIQQQGIDRTFVLELHKKLIDQKLTVPKWFVDKIENKNTHWNIPWVFLLQEKINKQHSWNFTKKTLLALLDEQPKWKKYANMRIELRNRSYTKDEHNQVTDAYNYLEDPQASENKNCFYYKRVSAELSKKLSQQLVVKRTKEESAALQALELRSTYINQCWAILSELGAVPQKRQESLLASLPELKKLKTLVIRNNHLLDLDALVDVLKKLPKLEVLSLINCQLNHLPKSLEQLKGLRLINLNSNQINVVSSPLKLPKLETLSLVGNPISSVLYHQANAQHPEWIEKLAIGKLFALAPFKNANKQSLDNGLPIVAHFGIYAYPEAGSIKKQEDEKFAYNGPLDLPYAFIKSNTTNCHPMVNHLFFNKVEQLQLFNVELKPISNTIENFDAQLTYGSHQPNESLRGKTPLSSKYPFLEATTTSRVYFDQAFKLEPESYSRGDFYVELAPFTIPAMSKPLTYEQRFKGMLYSNFILPDQALDLKLMLDNSLGADIQLKEKTAIYQNGDVKGKAHFQGKLSLTNAGLVGAGMLAHKNWQIHSTKILFMGDQCYIQVTSLSDIMGDFPFAKEGQCFLWKPYEARHAPELVKTGPYIR